MLVLSDSHGRPDKISEAIRLQSNTVDCVLFLGDGVYDTKLCSSALGSIPLISVDGNHEDATRVFLSDAGNGSEVLLDLEGYKILMIHGHKHGVKADPMRAVSYAYSRGADILLFGHTHTPFDKYYPEGTELSCGLSERGIYAFNPGSIALGSAGILELRKNGVLTGHFTLR